MLPQLACYRVFASSLSFLRRPVASEIPDRLTGAALIPNAKPELPSTVCETFR